MPERWFSAEELHEMTRPTADRWIGYPLYPSHPPGDYSTDPCVWHWYKDPADIPAEYADRYTPS